MKTTLSLLAFGLLGLVLMGCNPTLPNPTTTPVATATPPPSPSPTPASAAIPSPEPEAASFILDKPFTLQVGQEMSGEGLTLTFSELLSDDRCPSQVQCAEAGFAQLTLTVQQSDQPAETYLMNSEAFYKAEMGLGTSLVKHRGYQIEIIELAPYPETPENRIPFEEYQATFVVSLE